ncbi:PadR family transcriptional regulator [Acidisoma silvae]|uniref:PadR family transcriptional regulator n=1 Tax=Acidisoma silvae TaxID=2802396 RepID=A0A963YPP9_9PROT|nr:PadR family transcriptional regulator [Acidisoma silvae]MCB8874795.1 PadR family transcriptional regulator [Acidisoma silvae]
MFKHFKHPHGDRDGRHFARDESWGPERGGRGRFGRHGGPHEGGMREGGGRGGRFFEQGQLRLVLLGMIAEAPRHGYELIKAIEDRLGGGYSPSPGVIYPTLTLLSELGYATVSETEGGRKLYTITDLGRAHLAENQTVVDMIFARIDRASAAAPGRRSPQIVRAIENMKTALRLKMEGGQLTDIQVQTIAEALDTAARTIENA